MKAFVYLAAVVLAAVGIGVGVCASSWTQQQPRPATAAQIASFAARAANGRSGSWTATYTITVPVGPVADRSASMTVVAAQRSDDVFTYQESGPGSPSRSNLKNYEVFWGLRRVRLASCNRRASRGRWSCFNDDDFLGGGEAMLLGGYPQEGFVFGPRNAVYDYTVSQGRFPQGVSHERAYILTRSLQGQKLACLDFGPAAKPVASVCLDSHNLVAAYAIPLEVSTNGRTTSRRPWSLYSADVPRSLFTLPAAPTLAH